MIKSYHKKILIFLALIFFLGSLITFLYFFNPEEIIDKIGIKNSYFFVFVISFYGIFFRILRIDLLRSKKRDDTYWLEMEQLKPSRILKEY